MEEHKGYYERESRQHSADIFALCFLAAVGGLMLWAVSFIPGPWMAGIGVLGGLIVGSLCVISSRSDQAKGE